jgi:hypothetical protein
MFIINADKRVKDHTMYNREDQNQKNIHFTRTIGLPISLMLPDLCLLFISYHLTYFCLVQIYDYVMYEVV